MCTIWEIKVNNDRFYQDISTMEINNEENGILAMLADYYSTVGIEVACKQKNKSNEIQVKF